MTTSFFSGVVFVISSNDAIVMYRVDGVSGLKVLTGIKFRCVPGSAARRGRPLILLLVGVSYRSDQNKRCPSPNPGKRSAKVSKGDLPCNSFLKISSGPC